MMPLDPKKRPPLLTTKQMGILKALVRRNTDGSLLDVNELILAVAPGTTRGAMICSLRHMAMHYLVREDALLTRRGRRVRTYAVTSIGLQVVRPANIPTATP